MSDLTKEEKHAKCAEICGWHLHGNGLTVSYRYFSSMPPVNSNFIMFTRDFQPLTNGKHCRMVLEKHNETAKHPINLHYTPKATGTARLDWCASSAKFTISTTTLEDLNQKIIDKILEVENVCRS